MRGIVIRAAVCTIAALLSVLVGCDSPTGGRKGQVDRSAGTAQQKPNTPELSPRPGETAQLVLKAHDELDRGNFSAAFETADTAVDLAPNDPAALFVYSEALAANGDALGALRALDRSLMRGFNAKKNIYESIHLARVRKSTGFKELMAKYGMARETP